MLGIKSNSQKRYLSFSFFLEEMTTIFGVLYLFMTYFMERVSCEFIDDSNRKVLGKREIRTVSQPSPSFSDKYRLKIRFIRRRLCSPPSSMPKLYFNINKIHPCHWMLLVVMIIGQPEYIKKYFFVFN